VKAIRASVETCPQEPDNEASNFIENNMVNEMRDTRSLSISKLSSEEKLRLAKETRLQSILGKHLISIHLHILIAMYLLFKRTNYPS
jgi:hypothetical protein